MDLDINDHEILQKLRDDAKAQLDCPGLTDDWADAYRDFARAVDRLDAMWARVQVRGRPSMDSLFDGSDAHRLANTTAEKRQTAQEGNQ